MPQIICYVKRKYSLIKVFLLAIKMRMMSYQTNKVRKSLRLFHKQLRHTKTAGIKGNDKE
jgi:hypothetical protein